TSDATYTASFAIDSYTLTYTAGAGGTISGSSTQIIAPGADGTQVIAVPDTGYLFTSWSDGVLTASRTETSVSTSTAVSANFIITTNTVSYVASAGGTISGSATQVVNYGSDASTVTATPAVGHSFVSWSDGGLTAARTDTNVIANASYTATFATNTYTLSYSAGAGGTLSGSSTQVINYSESGSAVTPVPNAGYHFVNWSDASTANPRTDTNVATNQSLTANFAIDTFTVTYTAGSGGSITGSSTQIVDYNSSTVSVTAVAHASTTFLNWSDGSTANPRIDTNVTSTISVIANFSTNTYTLVYTPSSNGSISGSSTQAVDYGDNGSSVTAVPATGYHFTSWSDGSISASRSESSVTSSQSFIANFVINTYTLTYAAGINGSLTGSTTQSVNYNNNGVAVVAVPDTGYRFVNWSDGSTSSTRIDDSVSSNISVTASFALLSPPVISTPASSPSTDSATISWTTDITASTKVMYGPTTNYSNATDETDTVSRVTSHSVVLSSLTSCATYHYKVISANVNNAYTTSSDYYFTTIGCTGSSEVTTSTSATVTTSTPTIVSLLVSASGITLAVPAAYATTSADFQIKKLVQDTVLTAVGAPAGYVEAGDYVYEMKAITESLQTITTFDNDLTITMSYNEADVAGIVESTLKIFYWSGTVWSPLDNCAVDTVANSVTCDTNHFSTFGLFGQAQQNTSTGGTAFTPPAPPIVLSQPVISITRKITSNVAGAYQMAVSLNQNFNNSIWETYKKNFTYAKKTDFVFIKFRTVAGGESQVFKLAIPQNTVVKKKTIYTPIKYTFVRDLKLGAVSPDVKELQKWLNTHGYMVAKSGVGSSGNETTKFGSATRAALIKFQKANNISPAAGYFGSATRKIINSGNK
ncbi:MAG TPA: InlB B-repeat-containing protein, partial [Candidatus Magasanikbacteria bacterium]|nr:InlB B-repeat-containing protein [Candidatus Magasanikbacteria bacterium]